MKNHLILLLTALTMSLCIACNTNTDENKSNELTNRKFIIHYPTDTINYTDANGLKQGLWIDLNNKNQDRVIYKDNMAYPFTDSTVQELINKLNGK